MSNNFPNTLKPSILSIDLTINELTEKGKNHTNDGHFVWFAFTLNEPTNKRLCWMALKARETKIPVGNLSCKKYIKQ